MSQRARFPLQLGVVALIALLFTISPGGGPALDLLLDGRSGGRSLGRLSRRRRAGPPAGVSGPVAGGVPQDGEQPRPQAQGADAGLVVAPQRPVGPQEGFGGQVLGVDRGAAQAEGD